MYFRPFRTLFFVAVIVFLFGATALTQSKTDTHTDTITFLEASDPKALWTVRPVPKTITIATEETVGVISWETGKVTFEGDFDESAKVFFRQVLQPMLDCECK